MSGFDLPDRPQHETSETPRGYQVGAGVLIVGGPEAGETGVIVMSRPSGERPYAVALSTGELINCAETDIRLLEP